MISKLYFILIVLLLSKSLLAQTSDSAKVVSKALYENEMKSYRNSIDTLLNIKKQNPAAFYSNRLDYDIIRLYHDLNDTINFIREANDFINRDSGDDISRQYHKTFICNVLYKLSIEKKDTSKILDYGAKRLFVYNQLSCYTGEKHLRLKLFDNLIAIYTAQGNKEKAESLTKAKNKYIKKDKLIKPDNIL